mgnify:CR=1 FL=1
MASTKIINVSKSDSFEDIFEVFKNTAGDEIILIFPRGSKLAKASDYLESLKTEADASGKKRKVLDFVGGFGSTFLDTITQN